MELQRTLQNLLNAGIGLYKTSEENIKKVLSDFDQFYEELVKKGAAEDSELITNIRKNLDDIVKQIEEINQKASQTFEDLSKLIQENYQKLIAEIEKVVPKEQFEQIKSRVDELINTLQTKIGEISQQFRKEEPQKTE
ncbi:MAG: phasin family protein [Leptospiraceae bacterium]|nr:phasin family protein [Leptospiraceae bacterium]MDW7975501.1 phasin family protein [Leptospiraceae bacterium]